MYLGKDMGKRPINEPCMFHVVQTQLHTAPHCTTLRHTATRLINKFYVFRVIPSSLHTAAHCSTL